MTGSKNLSGNAASPSSFDKFHAALVQVHQELREGVAAVLASVSDPKNDANGTDRVVLAFTETLSNHHKSEDSFFFPAFRAAGRLRSSDVAFLHARDEEHTSIHRLCSALARAADEHRRGVLAHGEWRDTLRDSATELGVIALPHFELEEITLTPEQLASLITVSDLSHVYRDMGKNWNRR